MKRNGKKWWILAVVVLGAGAYALLARAGKPASSGVATGAPPPAAPSLVVPDKQKLVGPWMRTDAEYVIWIEDVSPDGTLRARYLNPRPINVARAEWKLDEGRLRILVEMRDRNYPGSYYTLTYDPAGDGLFGVYHQLVQNQSFEVSFYRYDAGEKKGQAAR
jgi:hypothetical protein